MAQELPDAPFHLIARSRSGHPSLLLGAVDAGFRAPVRLAGLEISYSVPCRVLLTGKPPGDRTLTVVTCTITDPAVQDYFLHVMEAIVQAIGSTPSVGTISGALQSIIDIMQELAAPPRKAVAGCFAELVMIWLSQDVTASLRAWRSSVDERFDFSLGDARLEVKASNSRARLHYFSAAQCSPPEGSTAALASLYVEPAAGGLTLAGLISRIERRLGSGHSLLLKLRQVTAATLGSAAATGLRCGFDEQVAVSSLQLYDLRAIPAIRGAIPTEVSEVRFRSDISAVVPIDRRAMVQSSPTLDALLPR